MRSKQILSWNNHIWYKLTSHILYLLKTLQSHTDWVLGWKLILCFPQRFAFWTSDPLVWWYQGQDFGRWLCHDVEALMNEWIGSFIRRDITLVYSLHPSSCEAQMRVINKPEWRFSLEPSCILVSLQSVSFQLTDISVVWNIWFMTFYYSSQN